MPEIIREYTNFTPGELTYHESVDGGEITAQEMLNLRVDTHGALRTRQPIRATLQANEANITGIGATTERIYFINSNGKLYYRNRERLNQVDTEIPIRGRPRITTDTIPAGYIEETKLEGRISVIYEYKDFDIITSEGEDSGYWIDLRDTDNLIAYPLGFNPPNFTPRFELSGTGLTLTSTQGIDLRNHAYIYRFTYIRDIRTEDEIRRGVLPTGEEDERTIEQAQYEKEVAEPFYNVESNPSEPHLLRNDTITTQSTRAIYINDIKFPNADGLERGIAIYRSRPILKTHLDNGFVELNDTDLEFRQIGFYAPDNLPNPQPREQEARFDDFVIDTHSNTSITQRATGRALRFDNNRLPSTVKQFTIFNDRIYAPNKTELRYSDIRFGNLVHWAFPEDNAVRRPVDVIFAAAYRDMLLWGGRNGLWRLTGVAQYNHDIDRLSNLGAVDPYAITTTEEVFGYISPAGLHVSTGGITEDISEPIQAYFENQEPVRGSVLLLPNGHSLWSVVFQRLDGTLARQTFMRARQWQQWKDLEIEQSARFEEDSVTGDTTTESLIVEKTPYIRNIQWSNLTNIYDSRGGEPTTDDLPTIAWSWKSQKLDFDREGIATERKKFTELIIEGRADTEINEEPPNLDITFYIYDTKNTVTEKTIQRTLERPHLYKTRVPIRKIGQAIEFKVEGQGNVDIRSFCLKGNI